VKVPIQNIYYLLCFAWEYVPEELAFNVAEIPASTDVQNLCAYVLLKGTDRLLRRGLYQGYLAKEEQTSRLRGRIDITKTVKKRVQSTPQVICQFDDLSPNVLHNMIIRSSIGYLTRAEGIDPGLRSGLRSIYGRLSGIDTVQVVDELFGRVQIHRNNRYYRFLLHVCKLLHSLKLPEHGQGGQKFNDLLSDEKTMEKVFEEFLRNFYKLKQRVFGRVQSEHLKWNAEVACGGSLELLPTMVTDVTLRNAHRTVVLDAKYYKDALQEHYGARKAHSENLYQLLAYLRAESAGEGSVIPEGILVYPTGESCVDASFVIDRCPVRLFTINLNQSWHRIENDLLALVGC
jgi:5-methylcytosine-specific restriction enzyme subunit McrC